MMSSFGSADARARDLKLKIKRLLLTDRRLSPGKRSGRGNHYAFFGGKPQGTGTVMANAAGHGPKPIALMVPVYIQRRIGDAWEHTETDPPPLDFWL
jgi:hypothetical protein